MTQDDWQPCPAAPSGVGLDQVGRQRHCQEQREGCRPLGEPERCRPTV